MEHKMRMVETAKLVPYINNARTHSPAQIAKLRASIREFGFLNPVIIDGDCGIIAGHGRVLAAQEEGMEKVPCVLADHLSEAQKKAYILADNRMAMDAGWDMEIKGGIAPGKERGEGHGQGWDRPGRRKSRRRKEKEGPDRPDQ